MIDVIYTTHNRLEYTKITLPWLIHLCNQCEKVARLWVYDDNSKDGTREYLESLKGGFNLVFGEYGNTVEQINQTLNQSDEPYFYHVGNDIILPFGIFDILYEVIENNETAISVMVQESAELPEVREMTIIKRDWTSSLGLHRSKYFKGGIDGDVKYYGFAAKQVEAMSEHNLTALMVEGITNTNLDASPWSRQKEYYKKKYARSGYVSGQLSVYKSE